MTVFRFRPQLRNLSSGGSLDSILKLVHLDEKKVQTIQGEIGLVAHLKFDLPFLLTSLVDNHMKNRFSWWIRTQ